MLFLLLPRRNDGGGAETALGRGGGGPFSPTLLNSLPAYLPPGSLSVGAS